jgi:hypothetical protein
MTDLTDKKNTQADITEYLMFNAKFVFSVKF